MIAVELTGVVVAKGECPEAEGRWGSAPTIGGRCVSCALDEFRDVSATLASGGDPSLYEGYAYSDHGSRGWSEYTPGEAPTIEVDDFDLWSRLVELDGQVVHLRLEERS